MGAAVLALLVMAGLGVRWWTHPTAFGNLGDSVIGMARPVEEAALSTTVIFPQVEGRPETIRITGLRAVFRRNTARATATFSICHMTAGEDPIGSVQHPEDSCADIEPVDDEASFLHGVHPASDYLFVTITPTVRGVAHLARVEVTYERGARHLFQRGTESIRADRKIRGA